MKNYFLIILLMGTVLLTGCSSEISWSKNTEITKETSTSYENKEHKFSLQFPTQRTFKENVYGAKVMFFSPLKKDTAIRENFWISVQQISSGSDLQTFYEKNKAMFPVGSTIESEENITIADQTAKKVIYSFAQGDYKIKEAQYLFIKEKSAYILTYIALQKTFNTYKQDIENIVKTISFK